MYIRRLLSQPWLAVAVGLENAPTQPNPLRYPLNLENKAMQALGRKLIYTLGSRIIVHIQYQMETIYT